MGFKKIINSDVPIIIANTVEDSDRYPPGFSYRLGGIIYIVKKDVTQEASSPMREVILSDGSVEIIPIESIKKDLREHDCEVLPIDNRYAIKPKVEKKVKKATKKVKKVNKKNGWRNQIRDIAKWTY